MQDICEDPAEVDIDAELLPAEYDQLIAAESLVHGKHNPRREQPSATLRRSVQHRGINRPLIVRLDSEDDSYHITDGWQRYQAATDCGWEYLPARVYESLRAALTATEVESIVNQWTTYEWAQYFQSLATDVAADSRQQRVEKVAALTDKARSPYTVRKYLDVLELPEEIHSLLVDGPAGDEQSWYALQNYNPDVRQYSELPWDVAALLGRNISKLPHDRVLGIAALAVEFETKNGAQEFVETAIQNPQRPLESVRKEVLFGRQHARYLEIPRVHIRLTREEKRAIMEHCADTNQALTDLVTSEIKSLVEEVTTGQSEAGS
jgi:ParB/RepB/Spo0J family partition protein